MTPEEKEIIRQWILANVTIEVIPMDEGSSILDDEATKKAVENGLDTLLYKEKK